MSNRTEFRIRTGIPRIAEAAMALVFLVIAAPLIAVAVLAVALTSGRPVFFRQERVGRAGRPFVLHKLRTMKSSDTGLQVTARDDQRITAVGRLLRRTKLDELPEIWNVIKGDMSLVGPRPEVPHYVSFDDPAWRIVLSARPGLTDPTTLRLRNEEALLAEVGGDREDFYLRVLQPVKLKGYLDYLEKRTWWTDVKVLSKTAAAVLLTRRPRTPKVSEIESIS